MVVKSTAFSVPPKCQSYNILNILIGLPLINIFIKTKKKSYSSSVLRICAVAGKNGPYVHKCFKGEKNENVAKFHLYFTNRKSDTQGQPFVEGPRANLMCSEMREPGEVE